MSIRIDSDTDRAEIGLWSTFGNTTGNPWTIMGWFKIVSSRGAGTFASMFGVGSGGTDFVCQHNGSTGNLVFYDGGAYDSEVFALSAGTWYHLAVTRAASGGGMSVYVDGVLKISNSNFNALTGSPPKLTLGYDSFGGDWGNFELADWRTWQAELTSGEVAAELASTTPVKASPYAYWRLASAAAAATDGSGNGRSLTVSGLADGASEPAIYSGPTPTLEQEGFRWRNDDGSETTATWAAAQDTDLSAAADVNKRLRVLINAANDPASSAFRLEYKKSTDSIYWPVAAHVSSATLSYGAAGALAYSTSGGTSVAPGYPAGITTKSALIMVVGQKPSAANGGTVTTPTGWTLRATLVGAGGYATTLGADTGNTNVYVYSKDSVSGTESGTLSVTVGTNNVCWAQIFRVESDVPATWSFAGTTGSDTSAGNVSITMSADPGVQAGDFIFAGMVIPTDVTTPSQFSAEALSQTGITFGTVTEISEPDTTTGNQVGGFNVYAPVSAGTSSAVPTLTATAGGTTTNVRGPGYFLRVRATPYQPIELATSANLAAGGEATTAQLAAPSGKSTSDFVTGRMWDDENGSDSLDITTDDYTELEWCIKALSANGAANGDVYNFRVTVGGTVLDTYSASPDWTIGGGDASGSASSQALTLTQASPTVTGTASVALAAIALALTQPTLSALNLVNAPVTTQALSITQAAPSASGTAAASLSAMALSLTQSSVSASGAAFPTIAANCWYELASSNMEAVAPSPVPSPGGTAYRKIMEAWGGAAWDYDHEILIVWGGGHTDYSGNEVYGFKLSTMAWSLLRQPCAANIIAASGGIESSGYYATNTGGATPDTNQPRSRHTYSKLVYSGAVGKMVSMGGSGLYINAASTANINLFDPIANTWTENANDLLTPFDPYGASCEDADGVLWYIGTGSQGRLNSFNPATGVVTEHGGIFMYSMQSFYRTGVYDPVNNYFWVFGGNGSAHQDRCGYWDLNLAGDKDFNPVTFTGSGSIIDTPAPGATWHEPSGKIVLWNGGTTLHAFDPTTHVVSALTISGSNAVTPSAAQANGTYGRFAYMASRDAFIAVNATNENVYFFKMAGASTPGNATVTTQGLSLTQASPTPSGSASTSLSAAALSLTQPSLSPTGAASVALAAQALTLSQAAPAGQGAAQASLTAQARGLTQPAATATGTAIASLSAAALSLSQAGVDAGGGTPASGNVTAQALGLTQLAPAASGTAQTSLSSQALALVQGTPSPAAAGNASAAAQALGVTQAAVTVGGGATAAVGAQALGLQALGVVAGSSANAALSVRGLTLTMPAVIATGDPVDETPSDVVRFSGAYTKTVRQAGAYTQTVRFTGIYDD